MPPKSPSSHAELPLITAAVPTYNRSAMLRPLLEALLQQDYPAERLELLIVDNNSSDDTGAVIESYSPRLRYIQEPKQGASHARNRAIAEAHGEILALTDDDSIIETSWVRLLCEPLITQWQQGRRGPEAHAIAAPSPESSPQLIGCVAGEVITKFPDACPEWIRRRHSPSSHRTKEQGPGPIPMSCALCGANMAFPLWALKQVGDFRADLDRIGTKLLGGGDSEMGRRIFAAGYAMWFVPEAVVINQWPASRATFGFTARHAFDSARSRVAERASEGLGRNIGYLLSRIPANLLKALGLVLLALLNLLLLRPNDAQASLVRAWRCCGYLYQISLCLCGRGLR